MFPFVFDGRKIAQGRVAARGIVGAFDELKDGHPRLAVRSEATPIDQLAFEGGEETLAHCIVVGVADRACRWTNAGFLAASAESDRRVLLGFSWSSQRLCALPAVPGRVPRQVFASQASCAACR